MAERQIQSAARLSEDIGDVLTAIRRLIAEDEALSAARDRLIEDRESASRVIDEDSAEFLARRHGGNAALARQLARSRFGDAAVEPEAEGWPLGQAANGADAARPRPIMPETPPEPPQRPDEAGRVVRHADTEAVAELPGSELACHMSATTPQPEGSFSGRIGASFSAPSPHQPVPPAPRPLRLDVARRVNSGPLRDLPRDRNAGIDAKSASDEDPLPDLCRGSDAAGPTPLHDFEAMMEEDAFAEAFDWKARMRPEPADGGAMNDSAPIAVKSLPERKSAAETAESSQPRSASDPVPELAASEPVPEARIAPLAAAAGACEVWHRPTAEIASIPTGSAAQETAVSPVPAEAPVAAANEPASPQHQPEVEEQGIRDLLREMIQEELQGEMGQRFSRNLRAVIRREIAAAIDDQLDRI